MMLTVPMPVCTAAAFAVAITTNADIESNPENVSEYTQLSAAQDLGLVCAATGDELNDQFRRAGINAIVDAHIGIQVVGRIKESCKLRLREDYNTTFYDPSYILHPQSRQMIVTNIARGLDDVSLLRLRTTLDKNEGPAP